MKLYCHTGSLADFARRDVDGFTTSRSLCRAAGMRDYRAFCTLAVIAAEDRPVSLEVCAQDRDGILREAFALAALGERVYVKVPECDAHGRTNAAVIRKLAHESVRVNVTAVLALPQLEAMQLALAPAIPAIISICAGRIADTGRDPAATVMRAAEIFAKWKTKILWASTRECLNIVQAEHAGADVIALSPALLDTWKTKGKSLRTLARETVAQSDADAREAGFTL